MLLTAETLVPSSFYLRLGCVLVEIRKELGKSGVLLLQSYTRISQRQADRGSGTCKSGHKVSRLHSLTRMGTGFVTLG